MFFELINVSANFQNYINKILHSFLNVFVFVYLNDILIYTKNKHTYVDENDLLKKHINQIKSILKKLKKFDLYFKFNKCCFDAKKNWFFEFSNFFNWRFNAKKLNVDNAELIYVLFVSKCLNIYKFCQFLSTICERIFQNNCEFNRFVEKRNKWKIFVQIQNDR